ncbi:MAG: hypothetical protein Q9218_005306 [Villophora microphyllina]
MSGKPRGCLESSVEIQFGISSTHQNAMGFEAEFVVPSPGEAKPCALEFEAGFEKLTTFISLRSNFEFKSPYWKKLNDLVCAIRDGFTCQWVEGGDGDFDVIGALIKITAANDRSGPMAALEGPNHQQNRDSDFGKMVSMILGVLEKELDGDLMALVA